MITNPMLPEEVLASLEHFAVWLDNRGQRTNATRLRAYTKKYQTTFTKPPPKDDDAYRAQVDNYVFVNHEVQELLWIFRAVENNTPSGFDDIMRRVLGGQLLGRDDSDSLNSRDYQFQLRTAVYFLKAGFAVDLSTQADILASKHGRTFFIECKRLKSPNKVSTRIKEAYEQLWRHLQVVDFKAEFYALAALDITKIAHPHLGMTAGFTPEGCQKASRVELRLFHRKYEKELAHKRHARILDVWLQIVCPGVSATRHHILALFSSLHIATAMLNGTAKQAYDILRTAFETT
jgi:hypothetical protein